MTTNYNDSDNRIMIMIVIIMIIVGHEAEAGRDSGGIACLTRLGLTQVFFKSGK